MKSVFWKSTLAAVLALGVAAPFASKSVAQQANGEALFNARCKSCHDPAVDRAPNRTSLAALRPADIVSALTDGVMSPMAGGMSAADKQAIATFLTEMPDAHPGPAAPAPSAGVGGPARGAPAAAAARPAGVDKFCETHPAIAGGARDWSNVGFDVHSRRFQTNPGLTAADVPKLKVKWSYAMAGGGMPTVVGDWLFITNRNGKFYALDAKTGCVHWVADSASRTTPMVIRNTLSPSGWLTLVGERNRTVRALDAQTGKDIWRSEALETVPAAGITGTPVISGDKVFVPLTSGEEGAAGSDTYECCKFQGSLAALDLKTGKKLWQTKVIQEPLKPIGKNAAGTQMYGPAGGAIWSAPTVDAKRGLVYVATGDSYTDAPTTGADAIVAIETATGKIRWSNQVTEGDNFIMRCDAAKKPANCPKSEGPDHDFGASPILFTMKDGKQILLAGQKSGEVYGINPDTGKVIWKRKVGQGGALGGVEWGMAADGTNLYAAISDIVLLFSEGQPADAPGLPPRKPGEVAKPGLYALNPATGAVVWSTPAPKATCTLLGDRSREYGKGACIRAQSAAPSVMPGVVFSGTTDGWFRAYDAKTGKILWAHSTTAQTYDTVNGVRGQPGGGIDGMGPAIANGMVFTMSGFNGASQTGGNGVNVLLAYSVDGK